MGELSIKLYLLFISLIAGFVITEVFYFINSDMPETMYWILIVGATAITLSFLLERLVKDLANKTD
jgi:hypothetical protein